MTKDLRSFIAELEARVPDDIARVAQPIAPRYEITALLTRLEKRKQFPLLFCEKVQGSETAVVINAQASRRLMAMALQCDPRELARTFSERQEKPIPPVEMINAPVHEVLQTGDEVDLSKVPILTHYDVNAAPYITAGIVVAVDPDTGVRNTSYNRLMMAGKSELRIFMAVGRHLWTLHDKLERRNQPLPIAIVIGVHPLFSLGAQAFTPATEDEYAVIGGMMGEPLRLVKAKTVPIQVPADAEMIIEGEILPHVRRTEGPFGEFTGHAVSQDERPVIKVTAITHRRGGIVEDFWPGHMDHWNLGSIPKEGSVYNVIKKNIPGIKGIHLAASGCGRCICYISIKKEFENEPNKAGMQAFVEMPNLKLAVIVDDDVDAFNEREVLWAVATRVHWDKDIEIIREVQSFRGWLGDTVAIVDATIPLKSKSEWPARNEIEPAAFERVAKFFK